MFRWAAKNWIIASNVLFTAKLIEKSGNDASARL